MEEPVGAGDVVTVRLRVVNAGNDDPREREPEPRMVVDFGDAIAGHAATGLSLVKLRELEERDAQGEQLTKAERASLEQARATRATAFAPMSAHLSEVIERTLAPLQQLVADMVQPIVGDLQRAVEQQLASVLKPLLKLARESLPPNWPETLRWEDGVALIRETGWALVWAPRSEIVNALVDACESERLQMFVDRSADVLDDVDRVAAEARCPERTYLIDCTLELTSAVRAGHHRAAASVLAEILHIELGHQTFAAARKALEKDRGDEPIWKARYVLIGTAILQALDRFDRSAGDPIPDHFNRHAIAHSASSVQYMLANALSGALLVAALLRELRELDELMFPSNNDR